MKRASERVGERGFDFKAFGRVGNNFECGFSKEKRMALDFV